MTVHFSTFNIDGNRSTIVYPLICQIALHESQKESKEYQGNADDKLCILLGINKN